MIPENMTDTCLFILQSLHEACRRRKLNELTQPTWEEAQSLRDLYLQYRDGDRSAWRKLMLRMSREDRLACAVRDILLELQFLKLIEDPENANLIHLRDVLPSTYHRLKSVASETVEFARLPAHLKPMPIEWEQQFLAALNIWDPRWRFRFRENIEQYLPVISQLDPARVSASPRHSGLGVIKYIEEKPGITGKARIGRVHLSQSKKSIYVRGRTLRSLNGQGYKANYFDVESKLEYWISNCKRRGNDTLYPGIIEIDEDAREEYWQDIRKQPENVHLTQFRSLGKYSKRRPQ